MIHMYIHEQKTSENEVSNDYEKLGVPVMVSVSSPVEKVYSTNWDKKVTHAHNSDKIKYLGIDLIAARVFKCSYDNAKRKFYRAFNSIFGKVGRTASEEVIIQLLKTKCLPVLYYGLEACPVNRDQARSLDYAVHSCFRKIFATTDHSVVEQCMLVFECHHVQDTVGERRRRGFLHKFRMLQNQLCMAFNDTATTDLELR